MRVAYAVVRAREDCALRIFCWVGAAAISCVILICQRAWNARLESPASGARVS